MLSLKLQRRWFRITPDRFVGALLAFVGLLWLSERFQWFGFNHHKGWTVLIAVAMVAAAAIVVLLWWAAGLVTTRRFQFGLRSLLAYCVAASIVCGWFAVEMRRARQQAEMVAWIKQNVEPLHWAQSCFYEWEIGPDGTLLSYGEPPGPTWLRNALGVDFISDVAYIDCFASGAVTDSRLGPLESMSGLESLSVGNSAVTDSGMEHLRCLRHLKWLELSGTNITDVGIAKLGGLSGLKRLLLTDTRVTDAGVNKLQHELPNCKIYR